MAVFKKNKNMTKTPAKVLTPTYYPIDIDDLHLAHYQRQLRQSRVKRYADNYNPDIFGSILVSHRDGLYWIVDGQHRVAVARSLGISSVWCQVLEGLTYEREADDFYAINDSRSILNANHKFHAKVEARDADAMDIIKALHRYGFEYSKEGNEHKDNIINAIGSIRLIYERSGLEGLCLLFEILRRTWNGDHTSLKSEIIKGVNTFIDNYTFDKEFLIKVLERDTPKGISDRARAYTSNIRRPSDGACFHIAKTIRDMYEEAAIKTKGIELPKCCIG